MSEVNLIKFDGKPLEKLIDVISKAIGTLYKPRAIRREADAKAYEIEIIERAKARALAEGKEIDADTNYKIQERLLHKEMERQQNIDKVVEIAAEQLSQDTTISDDPVDKDWSVRFFDIVQDISNQEMQGLWGRILAGETKKPSSFSLRTLELLRNLSKEEAECFIKFGQLSIETPNNVVLLSFSNEKLLKEKYHLQFNERLLLEELGLLAANDLQLTLESPPGKKAKISFTMGDTVVVVEAEENTPKNSVDILAFTQIGKELLKLIEIKPELDYIQLFASKLRQKGVKIWYAKILRDENSQVSFSPYEEVPRTTEELLKDAQAK
jgi:uncharacterized repeat protein (TIGR03899 family)